MKVAASSERPSSSHTTQILSKAEQFVADHDDLPCGEARFVEYEGGSFICLLVELPFDEGQQIWTTAQTARALHAGWL